MDGIFSPCTFQVLMILDEAACTVLHAVLIRSTMSRFSQTIDSAVKFTLGCSQAGMKNFDPSPLGAVHRVAGQSLPEPRRGASRLLTGDAKCLCPRDFRREGLIRAAVADWMLRFPRGPRTPQLLRVTPQSPVNDTAVNSHDIGADPSAGFRWRDENFLPMRPKGGN
jgi:hypothetical protein